jgi:hypothetical protein
LQQPGRCSGGWLLRCLVEQMQLFARLEADCFAWSDGDFGPGPWIATDSGFARLDGKYTKSAEFNAVTRNESRLHAFKDRIDSRLCFCPRKAGSFYHPLYEILLNHLGRPWAVIFLKLGADLVVR